MKRSILIILSIFLLILSSCQSDADVTAYVIEASDGRMLVAQNMSENEYEEIKDLPASEINNMDVQGEENFDLLVLLFADAEQFSKGDYIEAWIDDAMMDSYPPQVNADRVEIKE